MVMYVRTLLPAAAALFERTGGRVPSKETKTYLGAGLAVLGVNIVSTTNCKKHSFLAGSAAQVLAWLHFVAVGPATSAKRGPSDQLLCLPAHHTDMFPINLQVIASFVISAFREQVGPASIKDN